MSTIIVQCTKIKMVQYQMFHFRLAHCYSRRHPALDAGSRYHTLHLKKSRTLCQAWGDGWGRATNSAQRLQIEIFIIPVIADHEKGIGDMFKAVFGIETLASRIVVIDT
ncbi:MAG: hypothetical protein RL481_20 [Pseudomonadota bacterium]